jgi:RHS repeat-associated protein
MTSDGTTTWVYGNNNRPTSAGSTAFLINALGQRVKKTTGGSAVRFVYDESGRLWGEYDAAGTLIQETVWLNDLPVAVLRDNGSGGASIFYIHPDHLGSPRAITRASDNQFVWKWDNTEPFGNSAPNDNPSGLGAFAFNLRFPGQYYDVETGTHYNYFRDYDPAIGRYVESDPIGLFGGLSTYAYVSDSPLGSADPLGLIGPGAQPVPPSPIRPPPNPFRDPGKSSEDNSRALRRCLGDNPIASCFSNPDRMIPKPDPGCGWHCPKDPNSCSPDDPPSGHSLFPPKPGCVYRCVDGPFLRGR